MEMSWTPTFFLEDFMKNLARNADKFYFAITLQDYKTAQWTWASAMFKYKIWKQNLFCMTMIYYGLPLHPGAHHGVM